MKEFQNKIYDKNEYKISNFKFEEEGKEYEACQFHLNQFFVLCRNSKITPKKTGQFVTFWKRNKEGITEPFHENDDIDFYIINVKKDSHLGQFIFPKAILIEKGILKTIKKDGKRGFRVYPSWDIVTNKQAEKTQKWQLEYFYEITEEEGFKSLLK